MTLKEIVHIIVYKKIDKAEYRSTVIDKTFMFYKIFVVYILKFYMIAVIFPRLLKIRFYF